VRQLSDKRGYKNATVQAHRPNHENNLQPFTTSIKIVLQNKIDENL